jgi:hypothetical protein
MRARPKNLLRMKTGKEYPATHSMSTAWYIADKDGNVGILDFNENGPVPYGLGESDMAELAFGVDMDNADEDLRVDLSDNQVYEILGEPVSRDDVYWPGFIMQIYPERTDEFLSLVSGDDEFVEKCISRALGIYEINAFNCVSDDNKVYANSILDKVIKRGLIKRTYSCLWNLTFSDELRDGHVEHSKQFDSLPYYVYHQPYWPQYLAELQVVPNFPVTLGQLPIELQRKVIRLPIRFSETEQLQIAEWVPCKAEGTHVVTAYGCAYMLLPLPSGEEAYCLTGILASSPEQQWELREALNELSCQFFCQFPTVVAFHGPTWDKNYMLSRDFSELTLRSLHVQYLPFSWCSTRERFLLPEKEIEEIIKTSPIKELFRENRCIFEYIVNRFNPQVILIDDVDREVIASVYAIDDHVITVQACEYPIYTTSEVEANSALLTDLSKQSYRGERYPLVISVEDMQKIQSATSKS